MRGTPLSPKQWLHRSFLPEHDRKLLPEGRVNGPMPWVIAIMMFLTVLAAAAGIVITVMALQVEDELAGRLTVQITAANADTRAAEADAAEAVMRRATNLTDIDRLSDAEAAALVEPWLGADLAKADFPIPVLIDARLDGGQAGSATALRSAIMRVAPSARIESQKNLAAPISRLMRTLAILALSLVALLAAATGAVVMLTAKGALGNHRNVIEIMHLLGGTDRQISRLFQRRIVLDALFGGIIGLLIAFITIVILQVQIDQSGLGLISGAGLPWYGWIILAILPLAGAGLANLVARLAVGRALRRMH